MNGFSWCSTRRESLAVLNQSDNAEKKHDMQLWGSLHLDFSDKAKEVKKRSPSADVLNGIANDGKNLWVTGKNWPQIYKIKF